MGLVCSGRCGQDAVGPEPTAHTPTARRTIDKGIVAAAAAPNTPNDAAGNPDRGVRGEGSISKGDSNQLLGDANQSEEETVMPARTIMVGESPSHPVPGKSSSLISSVSLP
ncbi:hypothetical protein E2C01_082991 [Portunus trituberculatus]|uniref:Uncharacterized protein n=1 Tax=Portunus trituberculatus TaxID=210409 RepID=A0A5B7J0J7_PORTR|nr:hypothetical protein [Portunus trituberculatus]